jgi:beta-glucosidase
MPPLTLEDFATVDLRSVLRRLTMKEKVLLLAGDGWWRTFSIPRVGVPAIKMSDGPNGVRGSSHFLPTTAQTLPSATALGATFDVDAVAVVGGVLAREAKAKGSSVLLAPTCNIQRSPLKGRVRTPLPSVQYVITDDLSLSQAFESFSEDPLLNGFIAAAYVDGLQAQGVGAAIKHFTGNDQEHERLLVDARIPERGALLLFLFLLSQFP